MEPISRLAGLPVIWAQRQPDAPALVVGADRVRISYRDLMRLVDGLAGQLRRAGLRPGDRVAVRRGSDAGFVVGLLAATGADLVAVPLSPELPAAEQQARIDDAGVRAVLVDDAAAADPSGTSPPQWPVTVTAYPDRPVARLDATAPALAGGVGPEGVRLDDAVIMFTGGTTGRPKMVPWTFDNVASSVADVIATYRLGPRDATVAAMPLFHGHGLVAALLATLASGGCVLLPESGRFSAHTFWDEVGAAHATWYTAAPAIHRVLLERAAAEFPGRGRIRLRFVRSCSAPLNQATAQALRAMTGAPVLSAYGMTEATHQIAGVRLDGDGGNEPHPGVVGRSTGAAIRIVGANGKPCPPNIIGEIRLRGRTVVRGYLANDDATASTFVDGWLRTGDLGSLSPTGELTLTGRIKELINRGGEKISPQHVEEVLAGYPGIAEAAVFGLPDSTYGQRVVAVVVPRPDVRLDPEALRTYCRTRLAPFEIPAVIDNATALPHTPKGSLDRRAVAARYGGT